MSTSRFRAEEIRSLEAIASRIAQSLEISEKQVLETLRLLDSGNTIPFIARYRKEVTGGLDEIALRAIEDGLARERALAARQATVLNEIANQEQLTETLQRQIVEAATLAEVEAIYLPFKPKRRTRATKAREQGLQPLADILVAQRSLPQSREALLASYVDPERGVESPDVALQGALDIVAEQWAEEPKLRQQWLERGMRDGVVSTAVKRGKKTEGEKFSQYFDYREPVKKIPSHRVLAILRGQDEGVLRVQLLMDEDRCISELQRRLLIDRGFAFHRDLARTVKDCFERLLLPAMQSHALQQLKQRADESAIVVFGKNLQELLMAPPAGPRVTLGMDPGFRTGCKLAVVDGTGKYLAHATIFPTPPKSDEAGAAQTLTRLCEQHRVELIAIGNGTASRETDAFVTRWLKEQSRSIDKVVVSEAGASVYSASEIAAREFPDLDLTVRGAISIARRLQDPLAELVKTDPKAIGVGQYQHDVNQTQLKQCLDRVVESCVNRVGVDLNTASEPLLAYVSGIGPKLAENIVRYRGEQGRFRNRRELLKVSKLGAKAFEQAAGFLRIRGGDEPLDNSAVHPESYEVVRRMSRHLQTDVATLIGNETLSGQLSAGDFADERFGIPTVTDIIFELGRPGRDPRSAFEVVKFDDRVQTIEDLAPGMTLSGVVTNVTHFGAFVDLGVHQDGLIHISKLSDTFVEDPNDIVRVGQSVHVEVLDVDVERKRISLARR